MARDDGRSAASGPRACLLPWVALAALAVAPSRAETTAQFPEAAAVVCYSRIEWTVDPRKDGVSAISLAEAIEVRRAAGFDQADQIFFYVKNRTSLKSFAAATVQPDGTRTPVPPDLFKDRVAAKVGDVEVHSVQFSFPQVRDGAVLEWSYLLEGDLARSFLPLDRSRGWWEVQRPIPVLEEELRVRVRAPEDVDFTIEALGRADTSGFCTFEPTTRDKKFWVRTLRCRSVPAFEREPLSPPELDQRLRELVGWFWRADARAAANEVYWEYVTEFTRTRTKVREKARALAGEETSDATLVDRALAEVAKLKLSDERGEPPKNVDEVLQRGAGAGEEITLVALALLEEMGLDVAPVLAVDRTVQSFVPSLPDASQFDHLLLRVRTGDRENYIDPSCQYCQPGMPDWRFLGEGAGGIVLGAGHYKDVRIADFPAEVNAVKWRQRTALAPDGSGAVTGVVAWQGEEEVAQRRSWQDLSVDGRIESFLHRAPGVIEDPQITVSDVNDLQKSLTVEFRLRRLDAAVVAGARLLVTPPDTFSNRLWIPVQEERRQRLWWPYRRAAQIEAVFVAPPGCRAGPLPPAVTVQGPGMRFQGLWKPGETDTEVVFKGTLIIERSSLPPLSYTDALEFRDRVRAFFRNGIVFEPAADAGR